MINAFNFLFLYILETRAPKEAEQENSGFEEIRRLAEESGGGLRAGMSSSGMTPRVLLSFHLMNIKSSSSVRNEICFLIVESKTGCLCIT